MKFQAFWCVIDAWLINDGTSKISNSFIMAAIFDLKMMSLPKVWNLLIMCFGQLWVRYMLYYTLSRISSLSRVSRYIEGYICDVAFVCRCFHRLLAS